MLNFFLFLMFFTTLAQAEDQIFIEKPQAVTGVVKNLKHAKKDAENNVAVNKKRDAIIVNHSGLYEIITSYNMKNLATQYTSTQYLFLTNAGSGIGYIAFFSPPPRGFFHPTGFSRTKTELQAGEILTIRGDVVTLVPSPLDPIPLKLTFKRIGDL